MICTASGRWVPLLSPSPEDVCIEDIAHSLSNICRFTGHVRSFYSVAQHSVLVAQRVMHPLAGLFHDAQEAYLGDMASPLKTLFPLFHDLESRWSRVIVEALGYVTSWGDLEEIETADKRLFSDEVKSLMPWDTRWNDYGLPGYGVKIEPLKPSDAEQLFLETFYGLC